MDGRYSGEARTVASCISSRLHAFGGSCAQQLCWRCSRMGKRERTASWGTAAHTSIICAFHAQTRRVDYCVGLQSSATHSDDCRQTSPGCVTSKPWLLFPHLNPLGFYSCCCFSVASLHLQKISMQWFLNELQSLCRWPPHFFSVLSMVGLCVATV